MRHAAKVRLVSTRVTLNRVFARLSARAQAAPPNPPPTTTTRALPSCAMAGIGKMAAEAAIAVLTKSRRVTRFFFIGACLDDALQISRGRPKAAAPIYQTRLSPWFLSGNER